MKINWLLPVCIGAFAIAAGSGAFLSSTAGATSPGAAAVDFLPAGGTPPPGYSIQSAEFDAANGTQSGGTVTCPSGTVPWGGGGAIESSSLQANLNSSIAIGTEWAVRVNNESGSQIEFTVYAVCADAPADYQIVNGAVANDPAGTRAGNYAACPAHTVSLGGGGYLDSIATSVNLNGIQPITSLGIHNIEVYVNNGSSSNADFYAQVICGKKPEGYTTKNASAANPSGKQSSAVAHCPSNAFVVGGGVLSSSIALASNVNSTAPHGQRAWTSSMNNGSTSSATVKTYAVCVE